MKVIVTFLDGVEEIFYKAVSVTQRPSPQKKADGREFVIVSEDRGTEIMWGTKRVEIWE